MATRTSTETKREITRRGDLIIIKEVETITTTAPGKAPEVKEVTRVEEFKGEEGYKRLPEDVKRQLEKPNEEKAVKPLNKNATRGNFAQECLDEHNKYRKMHGVEPLKLNKELLKVSETRAKELADKDEMSSRTDHTYGENLSCLWSSDPDHFVEASEIVSRWYSEHKNYDFEQEPTDLNAGHFTQMIWQGCKEFGVAAAKSDSNKIYVVASYSPPGNYVGEFKNNVRPAATGTKVKTSKSFFGIKFGSSKPEMAKPAPKTQVQVDEELNRDSVQCHNEYRKKHGVPPLKYSVELARYAQEWANELASKNKMEHRNQSTYGENIYAYQNTDPSAVAKASDACKSWYDEIKLYDFNKESSNLNAGHFTQMIWKATTEVGMGRSKAKSGMQIIVANYYPPGNFIKHFTENIPKPIN